VGVARDSAIAFALAWFGVVMFAGAVGGLVYVLHRKPTRATAIRNGTAKSSAKTML
jgi:hypothetical protein